MVNPNDKTFMTRALELASRALGQTAPNPMVGAVLVSANGDIIGEGWHQRYGEAHAEVNAINSVKDVAMICKSTLYVTLEPCAHYGKTPPCADLIIAKGIPKVVVACIDPFEKVACRGIKRMQEAGIEVVVGVMEQQARELNRRFFTFIEKQRPYIILKWAQSADGALDIIRTAATAPTWLTGEQARGLVHTWRAQEDAIMVGRRTAELDNAELTVRAVTGRNPLRVVIDSQLQLSPTLKIFNNQAQTLVFTHKQAAIDYAELHQLDLLKDPLSQVLEVLTSKNIQSLIVEGGAQLLRSFICQNLWDEARIFTTPKPIADYYPQIKEPQRLLAPTIGGRTIERREVGGTKLAIIRNN